MSGQLALAGLDPRTTTIGAWVAASWAALVDISTRMKIDKLDELWSTFNVQNRHTITEDDRATWGLEPEHIAGQATLLGDQA